MQFSTDEKAQQPSSFGLIYWVKKISLYAKFDSCILDTQTKAIYWSGRSQDAIVKSIQALNTSFKETFILSLP